MMEQVKDDYVAFLNAAGQIEAERSERVEPVRVELTMAELETVLEALIVSCSKVEDQAKALSAHALGEPLPPFSMQSYVNVVDRWRFLKDLEAKLEGYRRSYGREEPSREVES